MRPRPGRGLGRAPVSGVAARLPLPFRAVTLLMLVGLTVVACRPPIADENGNGGVGAVASAGETPGATDTPPPALKLQPDVETNVQVRLFRGLGPADSSLLYAQALDTYRAVNLVVDIAPPIAGYDPFTVDSADETVPIWVGTPADVAPGIASGLDLVAVGELTGRDPTLLVTGPKGPKDVTHLAHKTVIAETAGAAASLRAALVSSGIDPAGVTIKPPDDPSAPFDPTPILDGTAAAAVVSVYDGWARVQEAVSAAGGKVTAYHATPLRAPGDTLLGELIWARRTDMSGGRPHAAIAALLGVIAQSQVACRDAVEDCAGAAGAQSDRTPEGLAWSIDQVDRLLFPAPGGILHIDPAAWARTVKATADAGVAATDKLAFTNDLVDAVTAAIGHEVDLHGAGFVPRMDLPLLPSP